MIDKVKNDINELIQVTKKPLNVKYKFFLINNLILFTERITLEYDKGMNDMFHNISYLF